MNESQKPLINPYTAGPPVFGDNFFGREKVFQSISEALVTSQQRLVVLHGQRRIGKTSILKKLPDQLPPDRFVTINFDLQFYAGQSLAKVLFALTQLIARKFELPLPNREKFEENEFFFEENFLKIVEQRLAENQRLLLLIDEFDIIRETETERVPVASREFTTLLQRLVNNEKRLSFMLVAGSNLDALSGHMQSVFRLGTTVRVSFFDEAGAHELIEKPAQGVLTYSDPALKEIFRLTSGHPYFTQLLCWEIFNRAISVNNREIGLNEVSVATEKSLVSGMGAFSWIWNELSLAERVYLSATALSIRANNSSTVSDQEIQKTLEEYRIRLIGTDLPNAPKDLVGREFLETRGPFKYGFTVELICLWIEKEHPLDSTKQDIEDINPIARVKFEEARRAYTEGKLDQAIEYYQAAVRVNPNHARAQIGLAQALFEAGEWERAMTEFERAYFLDEANARPGLVEAMLAYGNHLEKQRDRDKALSIYKRVLGYAPGNNLAETRKKRLEPANLLQRVIRRFGFS